MSLFKREPWTIEDVSTLTLGDRPTVVDIGFLGGEDHRQAFAAIFQKVIQDNPELFDGAEVSEIRADLPVGLSPFSLPVRLDDRFLPELGQKLYDSRNETVDLIGRSRGGSFSIRITFDNPTFWLSAPAV